MISNVHTQGENAGGSGSGDGISSGWWGGGFGAIGGFGGFGGGFGWGNFDTTVNAYTITMDVKVVEPPPSDAGVALMQTRLVHASPSEGVNSTNALTAASVDSDKVATQQGEGGGLRTSEGELVVTPGGGVGALGRYGDVTGPAKLETGMWRRIVLVVECKGKYVESGAATGGEGGVGLSAKESVEAHERGDCCEARWKGGTKWYAGKISRVNSDGTYDVLFDDGITERGIRKAMVRAVEGNEDSDGGGDDDDDDSGGGQYDDSNDDEPFRKTKKKKKKKGPKGSYQVYINKRRGVFVKHGELCKNGRFSLDGEPVYTYLSCICSTLTNLDPPFGRCLPIPEEVWQATSFMLNVSFLVEIWAFGGCSTFCGVSDLLLPPAGSSTCFLRPTQR